jgi:hypothetical protein
LDKSIFTEQRNVFVYVGTYWKNEATCVEKQYCRLEFDIIIYTNLIWDGFLFIYPAALLGLSLGVLNVLLESTLGPCWASTSSRRYCFLGFSRKCYLHFPFLPLIVLSF